MGSSGNIIQAAGKLAIHPLVNQLIHNFRFRQGGGITQVSVVVSRDFAQNPAHDLA